MKWWWWIILIAATVGGITWYNRRRVMKNMEGDQLSKNFTLSEFVQTATGLDNIPGENEKKNLRNLAVKILQPVRDYIGLPVMITSGFRSDLVNSAVGGTKDEVKGNVSQHTKGEAADFCIRISYDKKTVSSEAEALNKALAEISDIGMTKADLEMVHTDKAWIFQITNAAIIKVMQKLKLPYDQVIDEQLWKTDSLGNWRLAKHVHVSCSENQTRLQYLSARNTKEGWTANGSKSYAYTTIKVGYA